MRIVLVRLMGILMLLAALAAPATTLAATGIAAAITVTPAQVPPGGTVTVTGTGFAPGATLALFGLSARGTMRVRLADFTVGADGAFTARFRVAGFFPATPLPLAVVSIPDGAELATATVMVTDAPSVALERLVLNPDAGSAGTRFAATGEGFAAGTTVAFFAVESAQGATGTLRELARIRIPADGRVAFAFDSTGYSPGQYDLVAFTDGLVIGFPLVRPTFKVTASGTPGLPNTGGGAAHNGDAAGGLLLVTLGLLVTGALVGRRARRRRAN